jgi:hypothetical protein
MVDKYENFENIENVKDNNSKHKKKNIMNLIVTTIISFLIIILISWFGASLLFYKWAAKHETKCNADETLFDIIFPNDLSSNLGNSKTKVQTAGSVGSLVRGGSNLKECIERNKNIDSICSTSSSVEHKYKFNFNNPGLKEWSFKSINNTNKMINSFIKAIIDIMPDGNMCSITFLLGIIVIPIIYLLLFPISFFGLLINMFSEALNNKFYILLFVLGLGLFLGYSYLVPTLFSMIIPLFVLIKLIFYPLFSGGKDTLLKIINMNIKIINIIILITLTILVSMMNSYVSKNIYTGIIIGFVPIFLIYLNNIFN